MWMKTFFYCFYLLFLVSGCKRNGSDALEGNREDAENFSFQRKNECIEWGEQYFTVTHPLLLSVTSSSPHILTLLSPQTLRIVEETKDLHVKHPIDSDTVLEWLTKERILMTALENNLHQTQYTAKLMKIAEFIGSHFCVVSCSLFLTKRDYHSLALL